MKFCASMAFNDPDHYCALAQTADATGWDTLIVSDHVVHPATIDSPYPYTHNAEPRWQAPADERRREEDEVESLDRSHGQHLWLSPRVMNQRCLWKATADLASPYLGSSFERQSCRSAAQALSPGTSPRSPGTRLSTKMPR